MPAPQRNRQTLLRQDEPKVTPVETGKTSRLTARGAVCEAGIGLACVPENYQCEWYILSCNAYGTHKRLNICGTRNHPSSKRYVEEGIIIGDFFHRADGSRKKVSANGFQRIKRLDETEDESI